MQYYNNLSNLTFFHHIIMYQNKLQEGQLLGLKNSLMESVKKTCI